MITFRRKNLQILTEQRGDDTQRLQETVKKRITYNPVVTLEEFIIFIKSRQCRDHLMIKNLLLNRVQRLSYNY